MRNVTLAAALMALFSLPLPSQAQTSSAPSAPLTTGSYSVQGQPQGTPAGGAPPGVAPGPGLGSALEPPLLLRAPAAPASGTGGSGSQGAPGEVAPLELETAAPVAQGVPAELARLASEVQRLRAEVDTLKAEREQGTGGAGVEGGSEPVSVVSVTLRGRVRSVSKRTIEVIDQETGEPYVLRLTRETRAHRGTRRIPVASIRKGREVRASFELSSGDTLATRIDVLR